jgi:hypothetical protein
MVAGPSPASQRDPPSDTDSNASEKGAQAEVAVGVKESRTRWSQVATTLLLTFQDADLEQQYSKSLPKLNNISPSQSRREGCAMALGLFSLLSACIVARVLVHPEVDSFSAIAVANLIALVVIPVAAVALIRVVLYEKDPSKYLSRMHAASSAAFNLHSTAVVCFWALVSTSISTDEGFPKHYPSVMFDYVTFGSGDPVYVISVIGAAASSMSGASGYFALFKPLFSSALLYTCVQVMAHVIFTGCLADSVSDVYFGLLWLAILLVSHAFMLISIYHAERCTRDIFLHGSALQAVLREDAQLALMDEREAQEEDAQLSAEEEEEDVRMRAECSSVQAGTAVNVATDRPREGEGGTDPDTTALQACQAVLRAAEQELRNANAERKALCMLLASSGQRIDTAISATALCEEVQRKSAALVRADQVLTCSAPDTRLHVHGTMSLWRQAVSHLVASALDTDIDGAPAGMVTLEITEEVEETGEQVRIEVVAWAAAAEGLPSRSGVVAWLADPRALGSDMLVAQHLVRGMGSELHVEAAAASPPPSLDGRAACSRAFFSRPRQSSPLPAPAAAAMDELTGPLFLPAPTADAMDRRPRLRTRPRYMPRAARAAPCMGGTGESAGDIDEEQPRRRVRAQRRVAPLAQSGGDSGGGSGGGGAHAAAALLLNDIVFGGLGTGGDPLLSLSPRSRDGTL